MPKIAQVVGGVAAAAGGAAIMVFTGGAAIPAGSLIAKMGVLMLSTGISVSLGGIARYLQKVPMPSRTIAGEQAAAPWQIIYGQCQASGQRTFRNMTNGNTGVDNGQLDLVMTLACHRVQSIGQMVFDNVNVDDNGSHTADGVGYALGADNGNDYSGSVLIERYHGDPGAIPSGGHSFFPILDGATQGLWTPNHLQRGRASIHLQCKLKANGNDYSKLYPNGLPNVSFWMQGKSDVFDPRRESFVSGKRPAGSGTWTSNPALILADYLTQPDFGPKPPIDYATQIDQDQLVAAANECDELVELDTSVQFTGSATGSAAQMTPSGTYLGGDGPVTVNIVINDEARQNGAGSADTFYWQCGGGPWNRGTKISGGEYNNTYPGIPITGSAQQLVGFTQEHRSGSFATGIYISFPVTTGHVPGDTFTFVIDGAYGSPAYQHRYTLDGTFTSDQQPGDIVQEMLTAMAGQLVWASGRYYIYPGGYRTPVTFSDGTTALADQDVLGPVKISWRRTQRELYNGVCGSYFQGVQTDFPQVLGEGSWRAPTGDPSDPHPTYAVGEALRDAHGYLQQVTTAGIAGSSEPTWNETIGGETSDGTVVWINMGTGLAGAQPAGSNNWLAVDGNQRVWSRIALAHSYSYQTCQRLAKILLEKNRREIVVEGDFALKAYQLQEPDTVELALSKYGWTHKTFEVAKVRMVKLQSQNGGDGVSEIRGVHLVLNETDTSVYDWTVTEEQRPTVRPPATLAVTAQPAAPQDWNLTADLSGNLRLAFSIPLNTDYQQGDLQLYADDEINRVSATLAADSLSGATTATVAASTGFLVGDYVNIDTGVFRITGPGTPGSQPTSNTWNIARAQLGASDLDVHNADVVYRLVSVPLHFVLPAGWALTHPTVDLSDSGEYYVTDFQPGRLRVLWAQLTLTSGGTSAPVSVNFASPLGTYEPNVSGTLCGLRTSAGALGTIQVSGPLATGNDLAAPLALPSGVSIGVVYASVAASSSGADILGHIEIDTGTGYAQVGPQFDIPVATDGGASGSGTFFSGAQLGNVGGANLRLVIDQVGSTTPGSDLTLYVTL